MSLNLERKLLKEQQEAKKKAPKEKGPIVIFKSATEETRWRLGKIMEDPEREVAIPEPPKERAPPKPRDFNPNVQGSSAGAGSGEFHVYRADRRREFARQQYMRREAEKEEQARAFAEKIAKNKQEADDKTAKNRKKRQRKKQLKNFSKKQKEEKDGKEGKAKMTANTEVLSPSDAQPETSGEVEEEQQPGFVVGGR